MVDTIIDDRILFFKDDLLVNQLLDMNLRPSLSQEHCLPSGVRTRSIESLPPAGLDRFSTVLLSKSELAFNGIPKPVTGAGFAFGKSGSQDSLDKIDRNSSSISFFRDLKDYFTQNLFDKLRKYVNQIYQHDLDHLKIAQNDFITVTPEELRDRALLLKKCMSSADINIVQIYLALRERYKVAESSSIPSVGSLLHDQGFCKPCVFANKKSNYCKSGFGCNFCHHNHKVSKSKNGSKSFARLSTQNEFFNKLLKIPKQDDANAIRYLSTDDDFSISSSSASLNSYIDTKSPRMDEYYNYLTRSAESGISPKSKLRL